MPTYGRSRAITGSGLSSVVGQQGYRSIIKSIQRGTITFGGPGSGTATITSVNLSNSVLSYLGDTSDVAANAATARDCTIVLTNATTVTATAGPAGANYVVAFEVIEYVPGIVKSVQTGSITTGGTTATATITAVTTAKCKLTYLGQVAAANDFENSIQAYLVLTNSTTVTVNHQAGGGNKTTAFQVVEFY
jgi:hypothetical protein